MFNAPYWRLSGFYFFYFAFVGAFTPYWSLYLQELAFSAFQIGVLMSLLQLMRVFAPAAWGWLADHSAQRVRVVQIAAFASLAAYGGVFFGASFSWMFTVTAFMAFFWSASLPLVEATTLSHLGDSAEKYGRIRLWGSIGFVFAVFAVGRLLDLVAIENLPWIVLVFLVGIAVFTCGLPEAAVEALPADHDSVWTIIRRPDVALLFGACLMMSAAHGPLYVFYGIYLVAEGYSTTALGALLALGVLSEIAVFIYLPQLFRRFSLRRIMLLSLALAAVRFLGIGWGVASLALIVLAQLLHAVSFGAFHAAAIAAMHGLFRGKHQAKGQALYTSFSFGIGGTFGGLYSGFLWERAGGGITFSAGAICALIGLALLWRSRPQNRPG
ncbi:MAG: MFS transporter [Burkholderiales bacterium]|nr:MFS transporter [Burkholderiales bacterium]MDQ3196865.1 MFS transporter [Pseudomonadota bacterium]